MAKNLTSEDIRALADAINDRRGTQAVVPTIQVPNDRDSFATAGNFLRANWPILVTLAAAILYIPNQFSDISSVNRAQDLEIERNEKEIAEIAAAFNTFQDGQNTANSEIVRRLDKIQTDVETLKVGK